MFSSYPQEDQHPHPTWCHLQIWWRSRLSLKMINKQDWALRDTMDDLGTAGCDIIHCHSLMWMANQPDVLSSKDYTCPLVGNPVSPGSRLPIKMLNRTEPWGTPRMTWGQLDVTPFTATLMWMANQPDFYPVKVTSALTLGIRFLQETAAENSAKGFSKVQIETSMAFPLSTTCHRTRASQSSSTIHLEKLKVERKVRGFWWFCGV